MRVPFGLCCAPLTVTTYAMCVYDQNSAASGVPLDLPPAANGAEEFDADPALVVQLVSSDDTCWTSTFDSTGISKNDVGRFKAIGH